MPNLLRMLSRRPPLASSAGAGLPALSDIWASPASPKPGARSPAPAVLQEEVCWTKGGPSSRSCLAWHGSIGLG